MIRALTMQDILSVLMQTPEQALFDWKRDLTWDRQNEEKKAELLKDIVAIANATTNHDGFIFYGVDPRLPEPVVGLSSDAFDDSRFQQFVAGKVDPAVSFLFYMVEQEGKRVGVIQIAPSQNKPHIITVDLGGLRDGQIPIRRGSCTVGIRKAELRTFFAADSRRLSPKSLTTALETIIPLLSNHMEETRQWPQASGILAAWQKRQIDLTHIPPESSMYSEVNSLLMKALTWAKAWNAHCISHPIVQHHEQERIFMRVGACLLAALILQRKLDGMEIQDGFTPSAYFNGYIHRDFGESMPWVG